MHPQWNLRNRDTIYKAARIKPWDISRLPRQVSRLPGTTRTNSEQRILKAYGDFSYGDS